MMMRQNAAGAMLIAKMVRPLILRLATILGGVTDRRPQFNCPRLHHEAILDLSIRQISARLPKVISFHLAIFTMIFSSLVTPQSLWNKHLFSTSPSPLHGLHIYDNLETLLIPGYFVTLFSGDHPLLRILANIRTLFPAQFSL